MRCQPAEELAARLSIVDAQKHMSAEVRRRPRPEHGRLDLVQVERRRVQRKIARRQDSVVDNMAHPFMGPGRFPGPDPELTIGRCG